MTVERSISQADAVRHFNRFYTRQIGVLDERLLSSRFTLTQARVLFELGTRQGLTAGEIGEFLGLDRGYLSRIINEFASEGMVSRKKSASDSRRTLLSLTSEGKKVFRSLDRQSRQATEDMLAALTAPERRDLADADGNIMPSVKAGASLK